MLDLPITYAKSGGPPDDWRGLVVIDLATGEEVADVVEVDAVQGWLVRSARDASGDLYVEFLGENGEVLDGPDKRLSYKSGGPCWDVRFATERVAGRFEIRRP